MLAFSEIHDISVTLGEEALTELVVPNILYDEEGWTGIGIGSPKGDSTVVAFGSTLEGMFDFKVIGEVGEHGKVHAEDEAGDRTIGRLVQVIAVGSDDLGRVIAGDHRSLLHSHSAGMHGPMLRTAVNHRFEVPARNLLVTQCRQRENEPQDRS